MVDQTHIISGKGNTLEYIASKLPYIPIPEFRRFSKKNWWMPTKKAKEIAQAIEYPIIIRSDGPEDRLGVSYAGLFDSDKLETEVHFDYSFSRVRKPRNTLKLKEYAEARNVKPYLDKIDLLIQKYVYSLYSAIITRHPHVQDAFFIDITEKRTNTKLNNRAGYVVTKDNLEDMLDGEKQLIGLKTLVEKIFIKKFMNQLRQTLTHFEQIERLDGFDKDVAYQAEIGIYPYIFRQFRPFRKKEFADFDANSLGLKEDKKNIFELPIVIGITPKDGLELTHHCCHGPGGFHLYLIMAKGEDPMEHLKKRFEEFYFDPDINLQNNSAASFYELKLYSDLLDSQKVLPTLSIFNIPASKFNYAWQDHPGFRLIERGTLIGLSEYSPFGHKDKAKLYYWSDGKKGIIKFLE